MERFAVNMLDENICNIEKIARENGITMSWLYRALLFAIEKKFVHGLPEDIDIYRPKKFDEPFRQTTVCMYGDKNKWMSLSRIWKVELGPLLRFALELYFKGELELDLNTSETVKEVKYSYRGKLSRKKNRRASRRYIYQFQTEVDYFNKIDFRPKNPDINSSLMERGIKNRKNILIC